MEQEQSFSTYEFCEQCNQVTSSTLQLNGVFCNACNSQNYSCHTGNLFAKMWSRAQCLNYMGFSNQQQYEKRIQELEDELEGMKMQSQNQQQQQDLESQLQEKTKTISEMEIAMGDKQSEFETLQVEHAAMKKKLTDEVNKLAMALDTKTQELAKTKQSFAQLDKEYYNVVVELDATKARHKLSVTNASAKFKNFQNTIDQLQKQLNSACVKQQQTAASVAQSRSTLTTLKSELATSNSNRRDLEKKCKQLAQSNAQHIQNSKEKIMQIQSLKKKQQKFDAKITQTDKKHRDLVDDLKNKVKLLKKQYSGLNAIHNAEKILADGVTAQNHKLKKELTMVKMALVESNRKLAHSESAHSELAHSESAHSESAQSAGSTNDEYNIHLEKILQQLERISIPTAPTSVLSTPVPDEITKVSKLMKKKQNHDDAKHDMTTKTKTSAETTKPAQFIELEDVLAAKSEAEIDAFIDAATQKETVKDKKETVKDKTDKKHQKDCKDEECNDASKDAGQSDDKKLSTKTTTTVTKATAKKTMRAILRQVIAISQYIRDVQQALVQYQTHIYCLMNNVDHVDFEDRDQHFGDIKLLTGRQIVVAAEHAVTGFHQYAQRHQSMNKRLQSASIIVDRTMQQVITNLVFSSLQMLIQFFHSIEPVLKASDGTHVTPEPNTIQLLWENMVDNLPRQKKTKQECQQSKSTDEMMKHELLHSAPGVQLPDSAFFGLQIIPKFVWDELSKSLGTNDRLFYGILMMMQLRVTKPCGLSGITADLKYVGGNLLQLIHWYCLRVYAIPICKAMEVLLAFAIRFQLLTCEYTCGTFSDFTNILEQKMIEYHKKSMIASIDKDKLKKDAFEEEETSNKDKLENAHQLAQHVLKIQHEHISELEIAKDGSDLETMLKTTVKDIIRPPNLMTNNVTINYNGTIGSADHLNITALEKWCSQNREHLLEIYCNMSDGERAKWSEEAVRLKKLYGIDVKVDSTTAITQQKNCLWSYGFILGLGKDISFDKYEDMFPESHLSVDDLHVIQSQSFGNTFSETLTHHPPIKLLSIDPTLTVLDKCRKQAVIETGEIIGKGLVPVKEYSAFYHKKCHKLLMQQVQKVVSNNACQQQQLQPKKQKTKKQTKSTTKMTSNPKFEVTMRRQPDGQMKTIIVPFHDGTTEKQTELDPESEEHKQLQEVLAKTMGGAIVDVPPPFA